MFNLFACGRCEDKSSTIFNIMKYFTSVKHLLAVVVLYIPAFNSEYELIPCGVPPSGIAWHNIYLDTQLGGNQLNTVHCLHSSKLLIILKHAHTRRSGVGAPVVGELEGDHHYDSKKHTLEWHLPVINSSTKTGSLEFTIPGSPNDFFPIRITFLSTKSYCNIEVGVAYMIT